MGRLIKTKKLKHEKYKNIKNQTKATNFIIKKNKQVKKKKKRIIEKKQNKNTYIKTEKREVP